MITIALNNKDHSLIFIVLIINYLLMCLNKNKLSIYLKNEITTFDFIDLINE